MCHRNKDSRRCQPGFFIEFAEHSSRTALKSRSLSPTLLLSRNAARKHVTRQRTTVGTDTARCGRIEQSEEDSANNDASADRALTTANQTKTVRRRSIE